MLKHAKELLELCTARFPSPRPSQHHGLTVHDGTLVLTLMLGDTYQSFSIQEADLNKSPADLLDELAALFEPTLDSPDPPLRTA